MTGNLRIAVLGAGGVGGFYGGRSRGPATRSRSRAGEHLEAIRARGLEVRTPEGPFTVAVEASDDAAALGPADLAIVAVKTYSLDGVARGGALLRPSGGPRSSPS